MKAKKEKGKMKKIIMAIGMVCVSVIPATAEFTIVNGGFSGGGVEASFPAGVQGYWTFDDGTAADSSSNANHGVITGAEAVPGFVGGALDFEADDPNDHVRIPNSASMENITEGNYTMSLWVKPEQPMDNATRGELFIKTGYHDGLRIWTYRRPHFDHQEATTSTPIITNPYALNGGEWTHVLASLDRSTREMKVYVNGVLDGSTTYADGDVAKDYGQTEFIMGMADFSTEDPNRRPFDGILDEVAIWDRTLSAAEVYDVYAFGVAGREFHYAADDSFVRDTDYAENGDGWYGNHLESWATVLDGGPTGIGDAYGRKKYTSAHRGAINIITDNQATTGTVSFAVDLLFPGYNPNQNLGNVIIKVWGLTDHDSGTAGVQWDSYFDLTGTTGQEDGLDQRKEEAFSFLNEDSGYIQQLIRLDYQEGTLDATTTNAWQNYEFSVDLESGYDVIVVGISYWNTEESPVSGVDNLSVVPEPTFVFLMVIGGMGVLIGRRRLMVRYARNSRFGS